MMKTYLKTFPRMFKKHVTRLVSIFLMVLISIGFSAGIGMAKNKLDYAIEDVYSAANVPDLIVKSTREEGFTEEELLLLSERYGDNMETGASLEFKDSAMSADSVTSSPIGNIAVHTEMVFEGVGEGVTKVYFRDMPPTETAINRLKLLQTTERGEEITDDVYDIYVERETPQLKKYELGSTLKATVTSTAQTPFGEQSQTKEYSFFVRGVIENSMHFATRTDPSLQFEDDEGEPLDLQSIFYLFGSDLAPAVNDVSVKLDLTDDPYVMLTEYEKAVNAEKDALDALLNTQETRVAETLTLFENYSFASLHEFANKLNMLGYVLMVVFLLVTLLIVLSTMTRLLDEERGQIACLTTLGYSPTRISMKYLLFALAGTLLGVAGAYFAGLLLSYIIYINFKWVYLLPAFPTRNSDIFFLIVSAIVMIATLAATFFSGLRKARKQPAELLRPKSPKNGKKVILERIPLIWNRFSFKYKSTMRNVLRYGMRFAMTVIAVMASTALVLAGLAVLDCCIFQNVGSTAMIGVSVVVVIFAALLNFVVIYTLTNINISERNRELATLMVLGYHEKEVAGYVFREIYITGAIGILLGIPFGCLLCSLIFKLMEFGSIPLIGWYVWVCAPVLSLVFTFCVTLMLSPKIKKINMNESLKAIE